MNELQNEFSALAQTAGFVKLPSRTLVCVSGADRAGFLHNFCTADVKSLRPGQATEAFVLNGKGKIIFHVLLLALDDRIYLSGVGRQASELIQHLDKYIIREDVQLVDRSDGCDSFFVCGDEANSRLTTAFSLIPEPRSVMQILDPWRIIAEVEIAGPGFLIVTESAHGDTVLKELRFANIAECGEQALHAVRIVNRTPWFGSEIGSDNLPQELRRDEKAISFTKGCYLGQETVARINAIGHVNRLLVGLEIDGVVESALGAELTKESKSVGKITSVSQLSLPNQPNAMGFVRRNQSQSGTVLEFEGGTATVMD